MKSWLLVFAIAFWPAQVIASPLINQTEFSSNLHELKKQYRDETISTCFDRACINPDEFVAVVPDVMLASHSPSFQVHIQAGLKSARLGAWSDVLTELNDALKDRPDLPDIIVLKALAENKTSDYSSSLSDLEYLYKLRRERANGYKRSFDASKDTYRDELYDVLRISGQLDQLRTERSKDYERCYETYNTVLKAYDLNTKKAGL